MTKQQSPKQAPLLPQETALDKLDPRVRSAFIGGEQFVSIYDVLEFHGNKKNPRQAWKTTLDFMRDKQGFSYSPDYGQYAFEGKDGKKKAATPVFNIDGFLRLAMSAEVPEWESIRQWMKELGSSEIKSKAERQRESEIEKYKKAGYGDRPEIMRLEAYNDALKEYNALRSTYARIIDNPDYAMLTDAEYLALFGMFSKQLKSVLGNDNIRKALDAEQLDTMAFAQRRLRGVLVTQGAKLSNETVKHIIDVVVSPLGVYLRGLSELQGKPLLASGK